MKPIAAGLAALLVLGACSHKSTITRTGETVSFLDESYNVYVEQTHWTDRVDGTPYEDTRKLVYVDSRYLRCDGDCQGVVDDVLGP